VEKGNIETLISATSQVGDTDQVDIISSVSGEAINPNLIRLTSP